jgi:hypothetical protein
MGMCTSNLTGFGTGMPSMPQVRDAGPVDGQIDLDAAADAFVPYLDSGPGVDAVVPPVDAYVPALDAFVPDVDAFVPAVDAFVPDVDAFVPGVDAGT